MRGETDKDSRCDGYPDFCLATCRSKMPVLCGVSGAGADQVSRKGLPCDGRCKGSCPLLKNTLQQLGRAAGSTWSRRRRAIHRAASTRCCASKGSDQERCRSECNNSSALVGASDEISSIAIALSRSSIALDTRLVVADNTSALRTRDSASVPGKSSLDRSTDSHSRSAF